MVVSVPAVIAVATSSALVALWMRWQKAARAEYIRTHVFPKGLFEKLRQKRPELTLKDCQLVAHALRQYFLTYLKSGYGYVSMPSQVVDDLWHELILHTRHYERFCQRAFGRFLHHSPAATLGSRQQSNAGLRRCWWFACREENINPRKPTRLPLLFAIDAKLKIPDGFRYVTDCRRASAASRDESGSTIVHCGGDFAGADFDWGSDGTSDSFFDFMGSGDSGSDGGDGGGGGCGGGCGGD